MRAFLACAVIFTATGCARGIAAPPPPIAPETAAAEAVEQMGEAAAPAPVEFPHATVWTAYRDVPLRGDSATILVTRPFTALEVLSADSGGILVACGGCPGLPSGRVRHDEVVYVPPAPDVAAWGTLSEFALAIRDAAERGDTAALRLVMAPEFTFSFIGLQGVQPALGAWASDNLSTLSEVPMLLDQGLTRMGGGVWVAPAEHAESIRYSGPRLGFRRSENGRWEWLFLIRGEMG